MSSSDSPKDTPIDGSCFCGSVRFEIRPPTSFCAHCHCSMCRRSHGAAFVTWFGIPKSQFRVVSGEALLTRFRSSDHGSRSFCSRCGSSLFCELDEHPEMIDVVLSNMLRPIDRAPSAHVFYDDHVAWVETSDRLPKLGAM